MSLKRAQLRGLSQWDLDVLHLFNGVDYKLIHKKPTSVLRNFSHLLLKRIENSIKLKKALLLPKVCGQ